MGGIGIFRFGKTKEGAGGPPMIHMQTSFQSHFSFCLYCASCANFFFIFF